MFLNTSKLNCILINHLKLLLKELNCQDNATLSTILKRILTTSGDISTALPLPIVAYKILKYFIAKMIDCLTKSG
jgi:hypothetical protein